MSGVYKVNTVERPHPDDCGAVRVLPARVIDHSWQQHTAEPGCPYPAGPPPEDVDAMYALHAAVMQALAADWTPKQIQTEARQVANSFEAPDAIAARPTERSQP